MAKYTVAVAGATGYAGGETLRILAAHPDFDITCVAGHSSVGESMAKHMPHVPQLANLVVEDTTPEVLNGHDVIILALPHGASASSPRSSIRMPWLWIWAPTIASKNRPLGMSSTAAISMSIGPTACPSSSPAKPRTAPTPASVRRFLVPSASQVLAATSPPPRWPSSPASPKDWLNRRISWPIWSSDTRVPARISSAPTWLAAEALQSALPYSVGGKHRHIPEILQNFAHAAGKSAAEASEFTLGFTPILAPMSRGILATVSARMTDKAKALSDEEIRAVWSKAYEGQDFMVLLPEGTLPATGNIIGSNAAHLQVVTDRKAGRIYAFAAIDNLNRGTAGQAVQSLNIALGLPEDAGLTKIGVAP